MNCENCYYKKLCGRGGLGFKDDGFGKCERKSYLDIDRDEAFNSIYCKRERETYCPSKEVYDAANIGDEDAQEKPKPNMASFMTRERNKKKRDREFYSKNHKK